MDKNNSNLIIWDYPDREPVKAPYSTIILWRGFSKKSNVVSIPKLTEKWSDFLRQDIFTSIEISSNRIYEDNQYLIVYGTYLLLALIPYFFNQHVELEKYKIFFVIIQVLPLFIVAYDWGRWIFIISNLLFIFYYESDIQPNNSYLPVFSGVSFIALMMYVILWRIPYCCVEDLNIINLFRVNKLNFSFFIPLFLYFYLQIKNKKDNIQIKNN